MTPDEEAEVEAACLAALQGESGLIPWQGRRASAVMHNVEAVLTDRGWLGALDSFADREGVHLKLAAPADG
jgi:hypothetical protein